MEVGEPSAMEEKEDIEIPAYFLCPISMQVMKDPVTVATGATYDRPSIERWLAGNNRLTCPLTNQPLVDLSLTPNSTLRRLIESWRSTNFGDKRPEAAPESSLDAIHAVFRDLIEAGSSSELMLRALRKAKTLIQDGGENRAIFEKEGFVPLVASMITLSDTSYDFSETDSDVTGEAAGVLYLLRPSPETLKTIVQKKDGEFVETLCSILMRGTYKARIHSILLLRMVLKVADDRHKSGVPADLFDGAVEMLKDHNCSISTTMSLLAVLSDVIPLGTNRSKAVNAGATGVLVELLMEEKDDRRRCEAMLYLIEAMCKTAEGRSALISHPAGVAAVAGKMLTVSVAATARAVKVLLLLCKFSGTVAEEMMAVGAVVKLCMVVQVEGGSKSGKRAKEMLGFHMKMWSKSPCFPLVQFP